jgi:hypothetical protein
MFSIRSHGQSLHDISTARLLAGDPLDARSIHRAASVGLGVRTLMVGDLPTYLGARTCRQRQRRGYTIIAFGGS